MKIVYVGTKPQKGDNVAQTGLVWTRGQIHEVADEKKAAKLLEHPLSWADAEKDYNLVPELKAVDPTPRVNVIPANAVSPFWEPVVVTVPEDVFIGMRDKKLVAVFMTSEDADAFAEWKLERDTRPEDTSPKNTGPVIDPSKMDKRSREYKEWAAKQGLNPKAA